MTGTYDYRLVALSVVIAIAASYAALDLAGRLTAARGRARKLWLVGGAVAMGLGIWAMHYVGMLAFTMAMPILYDVPTVLLSLLAAIGASAVALFIVSRPRMEIIHQAVGSVIMGSGIAAMHYIGMAAMRVQATVTYRPAIVVFSVLLAIAISLVALILTFGVRDEKRTSLRKIISALVMGSAIPVMHYTGMAAAVFSASQTTVDLSDAVNISALGTIAISVTSLLALILAIVTSFLDRLLAAQRAIVDAARQGEQHFRTLAEAIPQIIWTAAADGRVDYLNNRFYMYTGLPAGTTSDESWESAIHPEDVRYAMERWGRSVQTGEAHEMEFRLRRGADGVHRWHLGRGLPIRGADGLITKWFGTCTDIDDQKNQQQRLEEEIKTRTAEVVAANARLQQEMQDRELSQSELNRQNSMMVRELTKSSNRASLLNRMGKLLQSSSNMEEAVSIVLGLAPQVFPDFSGALLLLNSSRNILEFAGSWGDCDLAGSTFELNSCWALRTGRWHFVEHGDRTAPCTHTIDEAKSYLCVPILAQGGAVGILHFRPHTNIQEPSIAEISLTETFAEQVGLSIVTLTLQEALRNQSTRDALTGLFNRRYLEESLEREIRRALRGNQSVGVIMFDLDHFKTFNDTYGHEAGDCILREMGALLSSGIRAEDIPCRFGGEEFVLILPGADLEGATTRAERLRAKVRELVVLHNGKSLGRITISIGIAACPANDSTTKGIIAAADAALYIAKRSGRDRAVVAAIPENTTKLSEGLSAEALSVGASQA